MCIIVYIYVLKKLINKTLSLKPIKSQKLLKWLIKIDSVKAFPMKLIIALYVLLFNIELYTEGKSNVIRKLVKFIVWLFKALLINPLLLVIYKFYLVLYVWLTKPLKELILQRFYGMVLVVLIFSPILNYIYMQLGGILLSIYIMLVIFNKLHDNSYEISEFKYLS